MKLKILVLTLLIAWSLAGTAAAQSAQPSQVEDELRALVRTWDDAFVNADTATLGRLLADEFAFVGGAKKEAYLASFKTRPADSVQSAVSSDVQVQVYGDTAVVVGLDTITGLNKGERQTTKWLYMDVWIKRDGRWQCVKTYSSPAN